MPRSQHVEVDSAAIRCRQCARTPADRLDQVSEAALGYLCSRCLLWGDLSREIGGAAIPIATHATDAREAALGRHILGGLALHRHPLTDAERAEQQRKSRGGRPRASDAERKQRNRDRQRAYRDGRGAAIHEDKGGQASGAGTVDLTAQAEGA